MTHRLTRRQALKVAVWGGLGGVAAACGPQPTPTAAPISTLLSPTQTARPDPTLMPAPATAVQAASTASPAPATATAEPAVESLASQLADAANQFLASLDDGQQAKARYAFGDPERTRWHWTTPRNFPRNGLPMREMALEQRDRALGLLQTGLSPAGFQKSLDIISLQNDLGNDPELYFVTVFGAPGGAEPWGWRFEGHHLSRHFTILGDEVSLMPFFLGAWPTVSSSGLKAMEREEWAARELITSLEGAQRDAAIFQASTLTRHVTQNQASVAPLDPAGVLLGDLGPDQQALAWEIIQAYLNTLPVDMAAAQLERVTQAGLENVQFGWAGSLEPRRPHYYRLQGANFLLEHDNSRNGGTHIHSVWRDFAADFGQDLG